MVNLIIIDNNKKLCKILQQINVSSILMIEDVTERNINTYSDCTISLEKQHLARKSTSSKYWIVLPETLDSYRKGP